MTSDKDGSAITVHISVTTNKQLGILRPSFKLEILAYKNYRFQRRRGLNTLRIHTQKVQCQF